MSHLTLIFWGMKTHLPGRSLIRVHFFEKSVDPTKCVDGPTMIKLSNF